MNPHHPIFMRKEKIVTWIFLATLLFLTTWGLTQLKAHKGTSHLPQNQAVTAVR